MNALDQAATDNLPLYEVIYRVLRQQIADESLPKGLVLGEAAVARAFQSSRAPAGAALRRLKDEGLLHSFSGRGLLIGGSEGFRPRRIELIEAGLRLPKADVADLKIRNRRLRIYPEVERIVASCLPYGRFQLNESVLAEHYGVSRTVAHEVLTQLDRIGLIAQDRNRRWYAGPLKAESMREHFEVRWLLEPVALGQAFPLLARDDLIAKRERIKKVQQGEHSSTSLERLERDLHIDTILQCSNSRLRDVIVRSQLPLIGHSMFQRFLGVESVELMFGEHIDIFEKLIAADPEGAKEALEKHLKRSFMVHLDRLGKMGALPESQRVPFLIPAD
jgi:DNA-binding GntR family transcriptional regulator